MGKNYDKLDNTDLANPKTQVDGDTSTRHSNVSGEAEGSKGEPDGPKSFK